MHINVFHRPDVIIIDPPPSGQPENEPHNQSPRHDSLSPPSPSPQVFGLSDFISPHSPHVHVEVEDQYSLLGQSFIEPSASQPSTSQLSASQPPASQPPASQSSTSQPSTSQPSISQPSTSSLDQLLSTFVGASLSPRQVCAIYRLSGSDYSLTSSCLLHGPTLPSIIHMCHKRFAKMPRTKLYVDSLDIWSDMVAQYKGNVNFLSQLRITLDNQPAIDTGGIRRQVYTKLYDDIANNKTVRLFEGPVNHLRPVCTAETRASGLLKIIGSMIAHSICQDGIGFPYMSPVCFWYIIGGEEKALEFATAQDLPADSALVISQVIHV